MNCVSLFVAQSKHLFLNHWIITFKTFNYPIIQNNSDCVFPLMLPCKWAVNRALSMQSKKGDERQVTMKDTGAIKVKCKSAAMVSIPRLSVVANSS